MALLVGEIVRRNAASFPERAAASMEDASLTYEQLNRAANAHAHAIRSCGVLHGNRIVCWNDTTLDILPVFIAAAKLGAAFAPLNASIGADEARGFLPLARPTLLIADSRHAEAGAALAEEAGIPFRRIGAGTGPGTHLGEIAATVSTNEIATPQLRESDPHVLFFTSGSTGRPKGVVLSHRANFLRSYQGVFIDVPERTVCMFPLFHMAGFTMAMAAWQTSGEIIFVASPTADALLRAVERRHASRLYCIPAIWARLLGADLDRYDLTSLRTADTGTSATPPELLAAIKQRFPRTVTRVYYGSTEAGAGTALANRDLARKAGSVGRPVPGVELRVTDEGEICLRSESLMDGYFDDPDATSAALVNGWYHSGDQGVIDDDGYLWVTGRLRDIIRTGGESVAPTEVEEVLRDHPGIREIAVVGIPDPDWGEAVCAVVVPKDGVSVELDDLRRHASGRLAKFKLPRRLELVEALPRTAATGQIQRTLLVERILSSSG